MSQNVGALDRYFRLFIGLTMLAFAFKNGPVIEGWRWLGLLGFVFVVTAFLQHCPAYALFGISTRERFVPQKTDASSEMDDPGARN